MKFLKCFEFTDKFKILFLFPHYLEAKLFSPTDTLTNNQIKRQFGSMRISSDKYIFLSDLHPLFRDVFF